LPEVLGCRFDGDKSCRCFCVNGAEEGEIDGESGHVSKGEPLASVRISVIKSTKISRLM
jgi:hypothetical protein